MYYAVKIFSPSNWQISIGRIHAQWRQFLYKTHTYIHTNIHFKNDGKWFQILYDGVIHNYFVNKIVIIQILLHFSRSRTWDLSTVSNHATTELCHWLKMDESCAKQSRVEPYWITHDKLQPITQLLNYAITQTTHQTANRQSTSGNRPRQPSSCRWW